MTEKEVYSKGVALLEEWEDVNYCEHDFKFKGEWLTDKEVVDLLDNLHEENEQLQNRLKQTIHEINDYTCSIKQLQDKIDVREALLKQYEEEYEQLKSSDTITNLETEIMKLKQENEQLKKELAKFKEWEKHIRDVKREELDRVFKMSIYEIAEAFEYYKKRIKELQE